MASFFKKLQSLTSKVPMPAAGAGVLTAAATDPDFRKAVKDTGTKATVWLGQGLVAFSVFYFFKQKVEDQGRKVEVDMVTKELNDAKTTIDDFKSSTKTLVEMELKKIEQGIAAAIKAAASSSGRV